MRLLCLATALLLCSRASSASPQQGAQIARFPMEAGTAYVPIFVQEAIDASIHERAAEMLTLSEAQKALLTAAIADANARDAEIRDSQMPVLIAQSKRLGAIGAGVTADTAAAEELSSFIADVDRFANGIAVAHRSVLNVIEPTLSDEQRLSLHRLSGLLDRRRWKAWPTARIAAQLDLSNLLHALHSEEPFEPVDAAAFAAFASDYETALTQLVVRRGKAQLEIMKSVPRLLASREPATAADLARLDGQRKRLFRAASSLEDRIADLNGAYVALMGGVLPPEQATRLQEAYLFQVYPEVFPNPHDISAILALSANYVTQEQREAFDTLRILWEEQTLNLSDQMRRRVDRGNGDAPNDGSSQPIEPYQQDLDLLQAARAYITQDTLAKVKELLAPVNPPELTQAIVEYRDSVARRRGRARGTTYVP